MNRQEVIALAGVGVRRAGATLLHEIDWVVRAHERWVLLGPNGAGKTTLLQVASTYLRPTQGTVRLLGRTHGTVDVRALRKVVGYAGAKPAALVRPDLPAVEIVVTGKHAAFVDSRWHDYTDDDWVRARVALDRMGVSGVADRRFETLSAGERQRVLIARTLMVDPAVLLLDEATTGLDLAGRESMLATLAAFAADPASPAVVLVTHHVEEIPVGFTHVALLRTGRMVAAGPILETLTEDSLEAAFGLRVHLDRVGGRYRAEAHPR